MVIQYKNGTAASGGKICLADEFITGRLRTGAVIILLIILLGNRNTLITNPFHLYCIFIKVEMKNIAPPKKAVWECFTLKFKYQVCFLQLNLSRMAEEHQGDEQTPKTKTHWSYG